MPLSSSSLAQLAYIAEATTGVTPTTGTSRKLRMTGESLKQTINKEQSKEIEASRQISSLVANSAEVGGGVNIEMSFGEYDPFMEALLMDTWVGGFGTAGLSANVSVTWNAATNTITAGAAPTSNDAWTNLQVGQFFRVVDQTGNVNAANLGVFKLKSRTGTTLVVEGQANRLVTDAVAKNVKISAIGRLTHGITRRSFSIERAHIDVGQYFVFRGCQANKMSLTFESGQFVGGSFDFIGNTSELNSAKFLPGTYAESQTGSVMSAVLGVKNIMITDTGGLWSPVDTAYSTYIKSITLNYDNGMQGLDAVGTLGFVDVMSGSITCEGTMQIYLANASLYNDFINQVRHGICWSVQDNQGNGYGFTLPNLEFKEANVNVSGKDQPVMLDVPFTALRDPVLQKTIFIDRF